MSRWYACAWTPAVRALCSLFHVLYLSSVKCDFIIRLARTSCLVFDRFWLNLNYSRCKIKFSSSSSLSLSFSLSLALCVHGICVCSDAVAKPGIVCSSAVVMHCVCSRVVAIHGVCVSTYCVVGHSWYVYIIICLQCGGDACCVYICLQCGGHAWCVCMFQVPWPCMMCILYAFKAVALSLSLSHSLSLSVTVNVLVISSAVAMADMWVGLCANIFTVEK